MVVAGLGFRIGVVHGLERLATAVGTMAVADRGWRGAAGGRRQPVGRADGGGDVFSCTTLSAGRGVCMMSTSWRDKQHRNLINFIATFLAANTYRLNFMSVSPDFIFNNGGTSSVAFVFETNWDSEHDAAVFSRANTLKRYGMELGCPTFVPVCDPEMGFEKIVKVAHARVVCKQQDIITTMRNERAQAVQCVDAFLRVLTSVPGIDSHDANALAQAIGSIEAIAKASKQLRRQRGLSGSSGIHSTT